MPGQDRSVAALPHDEARASVMEHAIRARIKERYDENPTFYAKLSEALQKIIDDMRQQLIDPKLKTVALRIEDVMRRGQAIVDWHSNEEVLRMMRRDIKHELRAAGDLSEDQLNALVSSMVEIARRKAGR